MKCIHFQCGDKGLLTMRIFLMIALLFAFNVTKSEEAQKPIPPIFGKTEASKMKDHASEPKQEITVSPRPSVNVNIGDKLDIKSKSVEARTYEEPSKWTDPVTWFTLVLAIANILLWLTTRDMATEAKRAGEAAKGAAEAARQQAEVATAEYIGSHIPRLIVRRVQLHYDSTKHGIEFVLANVGDSYAQDISGDLNIELIEGSKVREFERQSIPLYGGIHYDISHMITDPKTGHNATLQAGERHPVFIQSEKVSDTVHNLLTSQNFVLYFFGKISYWNRTKTISREMGFFRTYTFTGERWIFKAKEDDPDYEWS